ncbi:MAG: nuclear transport factor 2 family protein [Cryobacterium sp.]|uniref:nuclear transport factor 2 family protein n=1 Tax=unclassified Cryobacterium TaxID=2649013 RepID=UPI0022A19A60|nr:MULTISPECIES: nuclear transport factor 2 family protein [unclassified Cryobacterium]MCY7403354.1 nuclear transport factor 2 family protein [Cryobacterium sp.]
MADTVTRLVRAMNAHDLDALVACFADDFVNETPVHPERGFSGSEQVHRNWSQIFTGIPDLEAEVVRSIVDGNTAWTEWEQRGTRSDGATHLMRGVAIMTGSEGVLTHVRFYLEPVEQTSGDVNAAIERTMGAEVEAPREEMS